MPDEWNIFVNLNMIKRSVIWTTVLDFGSNHYSMWSAALQSWPKATTHQSSNHPSTQPLNTQMPNVRMWMLNQVLLEVGNSFTKWRHWFPARLPAEVNFQDLRTALLASLTFFSTDLCEKHFPQAVNKLYAHKHKHTHLHTHWE